METNNIKQKLLNASVGLVLMTTLTVLLYKAVIVKQQQEEPAQTGLTYPDKQYFYEKVIPIIWQLECGDSECTKLCVPDAGHITCGGVHYPSNPKFFMSLLNENNINDKREKIKEHLWNKYAHKYKHCRSEAFLWLVDTAILQGISVADKLLTFDCSKHFNQMEFFYKRESHLKRLKVWSKYGKGWTKRLNELVGLSWALHKDQMLTIDQMTVFQKKYIKIGIAAFSTEWMDLHDIAMREIYRHQRPSRGVVSEDKKDFLTYMKHFY